MVEDHPFAYQTFEGIIAEGEYGAGEVIVWDQGTYKPLVGSTKDSMQEQVRKQLDQGALRFVLFGEKLRGEFALIRQKRLGEKAWLPIKKRDEYASEEDITQRDQSVISGKRLGDVG
jgi:bifunctional non-homologous end joining protein LigD